MIGVNNLDVANRCTKIFYNQAPSLRVSASEGFSLEETSQRPQQGLGPQDEELTGGKLGLFSLILLLTMSRDPSGVWERGLPRSRNFPVESCCAACRGRYRPKQQQRVWHSRISGCNAHLTGVGPLG